MSLTEAVQRLVEAERDNRKARDVTPLENKLMGELAEFWDAQRRAYLRAAERALRPLFAESVQGEHDRVWNSVAADTEGRLRGPLQENIDAALRRGGTSLLADVGMEAIGFDVRSPVAEDYLARRAGNAIVGINDSTRSQIRTVLNNATERGWSYTRTADQISDMFDGFSDPSPLRHIRNRAEMVAVTEMGEAYETGRQVSMEQVKAQGFDVQKRWSTFGDDRVCEICEPNGAAGWIDSDDLFPGGHERPLGHPGCRCDMQTRMARDDDE